MLYICPKFDRFSANDSCQYMELEIISDIKPISPRLYLFVWVGSENTNPLLLISSNFHYALQNMKFI